MSFSWPSLPSWVCLLAIAGCGPEQSVPDAAVDGSCSIDVTLGTGNRTGFVPLSDGDPVEVVLGFQGFRMLVLAVRIDAPAEGTADLSAHLEVNATGVDVDQVDRGLPIASMSDGAGIVEDYLIFLNDTPASELVGHSAVLETVVRAGGCVGTARVEVELRDDDGCVDTDVVVPDASIPEAGLLDGAVACEDGS